MLNKLADSTGAERMVVVFDAPEKHFATKCTPNIKPTGKKCLRSFEHKSSRCMRSFKRWVSIARCASVEADDVIGTLAKQAEANGESVLISTGDKDFAQLVTDKVTLVNTMSDTTMTPIGVKEKFGVPPDSIIDFLALTGDSVDNVPGIPKCGPKTAAKWLNTHGTLDDVVANAGIISGKIGDIFREHMHVLPLSKALVTIKTDCDLPVGLDDLARSTPDNDKLTVFYTDLELNQFLRQLSSAPPDNYSLS